MINPSTEQTNIMNENVLTTLIICDYDYYKYTNIILLIQLSIKTKCVRQIIFIMGTCN